MKTILSIVAVVLIALIIVYMNTAKKSGEGILNPDAFKQKVNETPGVVIDVRTKGEFNGGHLKIADFNYDVMNGEFQAKLDSLDKNATYYLYCRTGNRSGKAAKIMQKKWI
jgi:phage shock protein E